ncbi:aldehyde dehydrogenase family protein, partial [Priestia megaterium]
MTQTTVKTVKNYIGGEWVDSSTSLTEPVYNPATGEVIAEVPLSTKADVDQAVQAANEAFKGWSKTAVPKRARILFKYQQLLV